jgi:aminoglycoside 6'-N-acetyltransferase I
MTQTQKPVSVRRLFTSDWESWAQLRHRLWPTQTVAAHAVQIATLVQNNGTEGYGGFDPTGRLVAFAEISIRPYANGCTRTPVPFLEGIFVQEGDRRRGVGTVLVADIAEELRRRDFGELCSDAEIDNIASHAAHHRWGFAETERVIYFRKALDTL